MPCENMQKIRGFGSVLVVFWMGIRQKQVKTSKKNRQKREKRHKMFKKLADFSQKKRKIQQIRVQLQYFL